MCSDGAEWQTHRTETLLQTPWFRVERGDVELPDGQRLDHYMLRIPPVVLTAMTDDKDRVLLVWRYRFIPGTWGWELPSGLADPAEDLPSAAAREAFRETGWQARHPRSLISLEASSGLTDSVHHVFWTDDAEQRGGPGYETVLMQWTRLADVPTLIQSGEIRAASTAAALLLMQACKDRLHAG
jgi:8-oxo-dGTP pyrophosphatase MutT (NUDIX family)